MDQVPHRRGPTLSLLHLRGDGFAVLLTFGCGTLQLRTAEALASPAERISAPTERLLVPLRTHSFLHGTVELRTTKTFAESSVLSWDSTPFPDRRNPSLYSGQSWVTESQSVGEKRQKAAPWILAVLQSSDSPLLEDESREIHMLPEPHYRSCVVEIVNLPAGKKIYGDIQSFLIRTKISPSSLLTSFDFSIGAKGTVRGTEFAIDPDECNEVEFCKVESKNPSAADVSKHIGGTEDRLFAQLKFVGPIAVRANSSAVVEDHEIVRELKAAWRQKSVVRIWWKMDIRVPNETLKQTRERVKRNQEEENCMFWFRARNLAKGFPCNAWWWSRHDLYDPRAVDPFSKFRETQQFVGVPVFLERANSDPELRTVMLDSKTLYWFPSMQMFLNMYRVAYLYEIQAVNSAHDATFNLSRPHKAWVHQERENIHVTITISARPGLKSVTPDIGTHVQAQVTGGVVDACEIYMEGYVYRLSKCRTKLTFQTSRRNLPAQLIGASRDVFVSCTKKSRLLNDEYDALTTVTNDGISFEQRGFFSFKNLVRGIRRDASSSIGQVAKVPGDDERITELRDRLDLHQQTFFDAILHNQHPKSVVSLQGYAGAGKSETVATTAVALALSNLKVFMVTSSTAAADALFAKLLRLVVDYAPGEVPMYRFLGAGVSNAYQQRHSLSDDDAGSAWRRSIENGMKGWVAEHPNLTSSKAFKQDDPATHPAVVHNMVRDARIIVSTLSACKEVESAKYLADVLVIDEASIIAEPSIALALVPIMQSVKFVVLVGDPTQSIIERHATQSPLANHMNVSILERLFNPAMGDPTPSGFILPTNRRQHPEVAAFASDNLCKIPMICTRPSGFLTPRDRSIAAAIQNGGLGFRGLSGGQREAFVEVPGFQYEYPAGSGAYSHYNGVRAIVRIVEGLLEVDGVRKGDIAVLSPYHSDSQKITDALTAKSVTGVEVTTIDLFMGSEADILSSTWFTR